MWPSLVDMSKDDCRKALRTLELEAYGGMIDVLRAQGHFNNDKKKLLSDVAAALNIPLERHKAEVRRAVNDETLNSIADALAGPNTATEWAIEGRRMIPLLPRPRPNTMYSLIADECADYVSTERDIHKSENLQKTADFPFGVEPASPEPSRTQTRSGSPSGVIVFPSGTAIQMKREVEEEDEDRKKRRGPMVDLSQPSPSSPTAKIVTGGQAISRTMVSQQLSSGGTPLKIALPTSGIRTPTSSSQNMTNSQKQQQVIIVSGATSPNPPSILQKTLSVPMKNTGVKPTVMYAPSNVVNTPEGFKQRPKNMSTPLSKPRPNTIVVSQGTKGAVKALAQGKGQNMPMHTKIVVQKGVQRGVSKPQHVVLQKPSKHSVMNVQVKTAQGINVPLQIRPSTKPVQIKDTGGQMKMVSISGGTKILPKPSQPVYVVTNSSTPLTMVTRTVPAGVPSRVMTVATSGQGVKWSQSPVSGKTVQAMQLVGPQRRHDGVMLVQKGTPTKGVVPVKDSPGTKLAGKSTIKPVSSSLAQSLQQLSSGGSTQGTSSVILVEVANQDKVGGSSSIAGFLHASGILHEGDGKTVSVNVNQEPDTTELMKDEKEVHASKQESQSITSLSLEEAVEMLNRSDTPETRALLSKAGIQISDEVADSEDDDHAVDKAPAPTTIVKEELEIPNDQSEEEEAIVKSQEVAPPVAAAPPPSLVTQHPTISTRPRSLDIYTTALTSADILDSFMEEEDETENTSENKEESKHEDTKESEATDSAPDADPSDPLDIELAQLTGGMD